MLLELAYKHPRTGKPTEIRQAVRIARQRPVEVRGSSGLSGVLGRHHSAGDGAALKHLFCLVAMLTLLAGCASGYMIAAPPALPDLSLAATIVVIRPFQFVGGGGTVTVRLDGVELHELGSDEHLAIGVAPGEHIVSLKTWDPGAPLPTRIYPSETVNAEAGRTYYFRVQPGRLSRAAEGEGRELVADTKPVSQLPQPEPIIGTERPSVSR